MLFDNKILKRNYFLEINLFTEKYSLNILKKIKFVLNFKIDVFKCTQR
jgi:hypothetical protein